MEPPGPAGAVQCERLGAEALEVERAADRLRVHGPFDQVQATEVAEAKPVEVVCSRRERCLGCHEGVEWKRGPCSEKDRDVLLAEDYLKHRGEKDNTWRRLMGLPPVAQRPGWMIPVWEEE